MTEPPSKAQWPSYMPLPREDIFALGVISLNYCHLENMFRLLFSSVARWNDFQTAAVFHRLANNIRMDVISELLTKTTIPVETKKLIEHFVTGFRLCADARNLIMHSSSGGLHRSDRAVGLVLERHSKTGNKLVCYLTLDDLRRVADDIHRYMTFGAYVVTEVKNYVTHLQDDHAEDFRSLPPTLRERPPLPIPLSWRSPDDPKVLNIPPVASHLLSPYRIRDA